MDFSMDKLLEYVCEEQANDLYMRYEIPPEHFSAGLFDVFVFQVICHFDRLIHNAEFIEDLFHYCIKYCGYDVVEFLKLCKSSLLEDDVEPIDSFLYFLKNSGFKVNYE